MSEVQILIDPDEWAKNIVTQIEESPFYLHYERFDVRTDYYRVYGRLGDIPYNCVKFHRLDFGKQIRGQGLFKALVKLTLDQWKRPVIVENIDNPRFLKHFERNKEWIKIEPKYLQEHYVINPVEL